MVPTDQNNRQKTFYCTACTFVREKIFSTKPRIISFLIALAILLIPLTIPLLERIGLTSFIVCPFHSITGLYCPGCGLLTALQLIFEGRVREGLETNIIVLIIPVFVFLPLFSNRKKTLIAILLTLFILVLLYGIMRNL